MFEFFSLFNEQYIISQKNVKKLFYRLTSELFYDIIQWKYCFVNNAQALYVLPDRR